MTKFKTTLLKIVGGVKKHMDAVFLTMGGILIPLGFYLKVEQPELDTYGTIATLLGLACWLSAYFFVRRREGREKAEREAERKEHFKLLNDICTELRKLNGSKTDGL